MSNEFANMLKDTLSNMQAKIKDATDKWDLEADGQTVKNL